MPPTSLTDTCVDCGSGRLRSVSDDGGERTMCLHCWTTVCDHCGQAMEAYRKPDGDAAGWRHERDDLAAPSCPAHKAEMVARRRSRMYLIQGGAA